MNNAMNHYIPRVSFLRESNGKEYIQLNESVKEVQALTVQWHRLKIMVNQETETVSLWLNVRVIFEDVPLRPEFTVTPAISFASGPGAEDVEIDDLTIRINDLSNKNNGWITLFEEGFERFEEGKLPENSGWKTTKIKALDTEQSVHTEPVSIHDTKHLIIKSIQGNEVVAVKQFNLPANFPFDISDRTFEIRYNDNMTNEVSSMESVETDSGHGPYGGAAYTNTSASMSSSPNFSRPQSGSLVDTYYIYSHDGKLMAEYDHNGNCVRDYIYSGNLLIAEYRPQTNAYYYYMSDQVNTTRIITDGNGNVVYSAIHSPYGDVQKVWTDNYDAKLKFSGKEREGYSELDYFGARYYDHKFYRFNSVDPIINKTEALVNPQLWNLYAYSRNNPVTYYDPDGRFAIAIPLIVNPGTIAAAGKAIGWIIAGAVTVWAISDSSGGAEPGEIANKLEGGIVYVGPGEITDRALLREGSTEDAENPEQMKKLGKGEIERLKKAGVDIHELKGGGEISRADLFKNKKGDIYVKPKSGKGPGDPTGLNINDF